MSALAAVPGLPAARPHPGDGRGQRHPGLVLRRRGVVRPGRRPSPTARTWSSRAPTSSRSAGSPPGRARHGRSVAEELRRVLPVIRALAGRWPASASTPCGPRWPRRRSTPGPGWSTTCPAAGPTRTCCPWWPRPACRTSACTGAATPTTCRAGPSYADVVAEVVAELTEQIGAGRAGRDRAGPADPRPGVRLRQDRRAQLAAAAPAGRAGGARPAAADRGVPEGVPRHPAGRRGRSAPPGEAAGRRHHGADLRAGRPAGLGRTGARRAGQPGRDRGRRAPPSRLTTSLLRSTPQPTAWWRSIGQA